MALSKEGVLKIHLYWF